MAHGSGDSLEPLPVEATVEERIQRYEDLNTRLELLLEGEGDWVSAVATVAAELHHAFSYFH